MFDALKEEILGKKYSLSIAFIKEEVSREINKKYRKKNKGANVLAFPFSRSEGEILICKKVARREAKKFEKTYQEFLNYLVIHGMLHLAGMRHGSIMEKSENFYLSKYDKKYFSRNRRGILSNPGRSGRIHKRRKKS